MTPCNSADNLICICYGPCWVLAPAFRGKMHTTTLTSMVKLLDGSCSGVSWLPPSTAGLKGVVCGSSRQNLLPGLQNRLLQYHPLSIDFLFISHFHQKLLFKCTSNSLEYLAHLWYQLCLLFPQYFQGIFVVCSMALPLSETFFSKST